MSKDQTQQSGDLLWGAAAIAKHIRRTVRQVYYLIEQEKLPVTKLGPRTIVGSRAKIDARLQSDGRPRKDATRAGAEVA